MHDSPSASTPAFDLLASGLQRQLYAMRWPSLRPVQVRAIRHYLQSNDHLLIMAETAGGKTEAAFLPVLSTVSEEVPRSVRALYIGPLKALINDQFRRLEDLCTHLDVPVTRWHGDVSASTKAGLLKEPNGVLLITPESLESLLINQTAQLQRVFGGVRAIVIDELHAFLENERGLHLASLLARLTRYRSPEAPLPRMIGLSATVGDVDVARRYLAPDRMDSVCLITDEGAHKEIQCRLHGYDRQVSIDQRGRTPADPSGEAGPEPVDLMQMRRIAGDLVQHCRGHSNLVFANAKGDIELFADIANECCSEIGLPESFLVHHGSLAKDVREDTELAMKKGDAPRTTVCSSTLEMGIDIGSVRMIGQIGAPWSVASLKQRMGRSGRRDDEPRRLRMYIEYGGHSDEGDPLDVLPLQMLQTISTVELMLEGWIEPPRPPQLDLSTLSHQIISSIAETGSLQPVELHDRLCKRGPFRAVTTGIFASVLRTLAAKDVLEQGPDGRLILGLEGEHIRSQRDFYAAFASRTEFSVVAPDRILGTIPVESAPKPDEHIVFAARRWRVVSVDESKLEMHVVPARRRQRPKFMGAPGDVHARIRERMRLVLGQGTVPAYLDSSAAAALQMARSVAASHELARCWLMPLSDHRTLWLTWTSTATQRTLLAILAELGVEASDREIAIECAVARDSLMSRLQVGHAMLTDPLRLAKHVAPKQMRKYDALLTDSLLEQAIAVDRFDTEEARRLIEYLIRL